MRLSNKIMTVIAVLAIVGFAGFSFAHGGYGNRGWYGHHMGYGYGPHMGYYDGGQYSGLSDNEIEKIEKAKEDFYKSTEKTREALYQKRIELRNELAKQNPDTKKLKAIQKDVSRLETELDENALDFQVEVNKIAPNARGGFARRGFGYRGTGGYCWE